MPNWDEAEGEVKEQAGRVTGDQDAENEGRAQETWGDAKDKADDAKDKAGDAVDDVKDKF
jgi:uncharacterized protein YjbJ (UPF0337 family)